MKPLRSYSIYRKYLRDLLAETKKANPSLSVEKYAKRLGMGSSAFKMILSGKRNLTVHQIPSLARALKLSPDDWDYFEALVLHEQAKTPLERAHFRKRLRRADPGKVTGQVLITQNQLLSEHVILPVLIYLLEVRKNRPASQEFGAEEAADLAAQLGTEPSNVTRAFKMLSEAGLLSSHPDQAYHFVFDRLTHPLKQKAYLKHWFGQGARRMESDYERTETLFNASTLALSKTDLSAFILEQRGLLEKYMTRSQHASADTLVQACLQIFPVFEETALRRPRSLPAVGSRPRAP